MAASLYSAEELSTLGLVSDDGDPVGQSSAIDASLIGSSGTPPQSRPGTAAAPAWSLCPSGGYRMADGGAAIVHVRSNAKASSLKKHSDKERGDLAVGNPVVTHGVRCLELCLETPHGSGDVYLGVCDASAPLNASIAGKA